MITILYPVNKLVIGGAEQQLLELLRGLDKSRFHPIVVSLYPGGPLDGEYRAVPGIEVIDLNRGGKYDMTVIWQFIRLMRTRHVDVVQPFTTPAAFFGLLAALLVGTPAKVVRESCGVQRFSPRGLLAYRWLEDRLTRFADSVVSNSAAGGEDLLRRGIPAERIRVIYNGVNPDRLQSNPEGVEAGRARLRVPTGGSAIGILASLTPAKDHASFLRAAALVSVKRPEVRFAIVGDGPLRGQLESLATELSLGERVVFFGNQRRVADFVGGWDVLVSSSSDKEGCSNSILEAMGLGVAVIATDAGGNRELVQTGSTGYLVPPGDHVALATAMEQALADPAHRHVVAQRGQQMVNTRFSLARMVSDYETLYTSLHTARRRGSIPRELIAR
ncbi:MAG: glycosyltransferase [Chloroflexota bacterium]|nr:MAG: glycosyltransferase [Chloroflexota bacterium]